MIKTWIVKREQMMAKGRRKDRSVNAFAIVAFSLQASSLGFIRDDAASDHRLRTTVMKSTTYCGPQLSSHLAMASISLTSGSTA